MRLIRTWLMSVMLLAAPSAFAAVEITPALVRSGYFLAPDCTPTADPKIYNECVCQADIKKAEVRGLAADAMSVLNQNLAMLPEKLAAESCEGSPTTPLGGDLKVNKASAAYEVVFQTPKVLTVLITYSTYGAGAEHPLDGTEGFTFDLKTGHVVDPIARLKPEELAKADSFIKQELLKKYPTALFEEAKTRTDPYLTENGCDTCTLFYNKEGWVVRFQLAAIAPYMTGEPEIVIPESIIPSPETLMTKI